MTSHAPTGLARHVAGGHPVNVRGLGRASSWKGGRPPMSHLVGDREREPREARRLEQLRRDGWQQRGVSGVAKCRRSRLPRQARQARTSDRRAHRALRPGHQRRSRDRAAPPPARGRLLAQARHRTLRALRPAQDRRCHVDRPGCLSVTGSAAGGGSDRSAAPQPPPRVEFPICDPQPFPAPLPARARPAASSRPRLLHPLRAK
jgi:hypothetical protein